MAKAQILVVEDDRIVGEDIKESLQGLGFGVPGIVASGEEAIASAREMSPDLVLMDIMLKGDMDGIDAARQIRVEYDIPVVYLTAYADEEVLGRAKLTEPFGYIIKPFEERELRTNIEIALYKHRVERELQASRKWLSTTLKSIGDAVIATDTQGKITLMNPVAESLTGWKQEEAVDVPLQQVFRIVNEDSREEVDSPVSKVLRQGGIVGLANHTLLIARDGTEIAIDDSGAPIRDDKGNLIGVVLVFRDVRERRRTEKALSDRERYYRSLISNLREDILVIDPEYRILDVNNSFLSTTGHRREEVVGRKCFEVTHGYEGPCVEMGEACQLAEVFRTGESRSYVHRHEHTDGIHRWVDILLSPLRDEQGNTTHVIETVRDVTDLRTLEEEKDRLLSLSRDLICVVGHDGRFRYLNPAWEETLGYTEQELMSRPYRDFVHPEDHATDEEEFARVSSGRQMFDFQNRYICKDGTIRTINWAATPLVEAEAVYAIGRDVTERREAEVRLRNNLKLLQTLLDTIPNPVFYKDAKGNYQGCNVAFSEQILGLPREKIIGRSVFDLSEAIPSDLAEIYHEQDLKLMREAGTQFYEAQVQCADGLRRDFFFNKACYGDGAAEQAAGMVGVMLDITERKKAERSLRYERDRLQTYLDAAPSMFVALDREGRVTLVNNRGVEILEYGPDEIIGKDWFENFLPEGIRDEIKGVFRALLRGEMKSVEFNENPVLTKGGEERLIAWHNILLYDTDAGLSGILASGEDVTERRRLAKEREQLEKQLRQGQKMEALGTLAGGIAHDFNNILAVVNGYAELALLEAEEKTELHSALEEVLHAGLRGRDLANQILTFSRQSEQERRPLDVVQILKETLRFLRASIPTTIEMRQNVGVKTGMFMGDPTQIHQVIMNLCTNAAHAMAEKGGILSVDLNRIDLAADDVKYRAVLSPGPYLELSVSDTGHGMEKAVMDRIFDPFYTTKGPGEGTGMGLSVVHGIVTSQGGSISVSSEPGEGTRFEILLPRLTRAGEEQRVAREPIVSGEARILLVDDEEGIVRIHRSMLGRAGYEVIGRTSSIEALEAFRENPDRFDLVITDMTMPQMTGLELSREILQLRPDIPIIICTGYSEALSPEKIREMGIRDSLMKPVLASDMTATIARVLSEDSQKPSDP